MRVVIAPDKFKGCLPAPAVADAMAAGVRDAVPNAAVDACPVADGGEGFSAALASATGGRVVTRRVTGPLPERKVDAAFALLGDGQTAAVEAAAASGLALLDPADRDPEATTTFGTGELIRHAVEMGCTRVLVGLGGTATCDAGIGCLQACGSPVLLAGGEVAYDTEPLCGRDVGDVVLVKRGRGGRVDGVALTLACDVDNPLLGGRGAARTFAPQKGATPAAVDRLEAAIARLVERTGTRDYADAPGAGAAGGLAYGLSAFLGATLANGFDLVAGAVRLDERLAGADLCVTGEGRFDATSLGGKAAVGVARRCRAAGVPCLVVAGSVEAGVDGSGEGASAVVAATPPGVPLDRAVADAPALVRAATARAVRAWLATRG